MTNGLDTTFLIQAEVVEHPGHAAARQLVSEILESQEALALAPQVLSEFVHIVTDPRRFSKPLEMRAALTRAQSWWRAREVVQACPTDESTRLFLEWMARHRLGRKRLLDTQLAATYYSHGIKTIVTTNVQDYSVFDCFTLRSP